MDWLNQHLELIAYVAGAVLTFTIWNVSQGMRLKAIEKAVGQFNEKEFTDFKTAVAKKFEHTEGELSAIRLRQENVEKGLMEELRRVGEKLAHIEGFLVGRKQASTKR